jgi:hypothetical protein
MITTVLAQLFASMASRKKPSAILGEEETVVEVYADALSEILVGEPDEPAAQGS